MVLCLVLGSSLLACKKATTTSTTSSSGGDTVTEDSSASGIAVSAIGGTILSLTNGSSPTLGYQETASNACPTFMSNAGSGCTNTSTSLVSLTYSNCSFGSSTATWSGADLISLTNGTISCGTAPTIPPNGILGHGFTGNRTASSGTVIAASIDGTNYTGSTAANQWEQVRYTLGTLSTVIVAGVRFKSNSPSIDYTMDQFQSTGLTLGTTATSKIVSGNLTVYDNINGVTGTSTLSSVTYTASCCQPTGGTISTSFVAGTNGSVGSSYNGNTETMVFTGTCGQGQYTGVNGTTQTVSLVHCL
ncbi:MAG: hypothetical protein C5B49_14490 [Bdellovibrio sp.]|nr:MAG: hypothetical protein C5B49_14490 [Bdellovibrio sp.]